MTDFDNDELASAYLDDAVTDEERARVDADPALLRRVDELRRVRTELRASVVEPASAEVRDSAIASAIAAGVTASPVIDLQAERARRRLRIASIAAAALLLIGAAGLLLRSLSTDSSTKTSATAAASSSSTAGDSLSAPTTSVVVNGLLGAYPNRDALVASVAASARYAAQATSAAGAANDNAAPRAAESSTTTACVVAPPDNTATQIYRENATLEGLPVQIDVFALSGGSRRLVVTNAGTCTLVFTQAL